MAKWIGQAVEDVNNKVDIKEFFLKTGCLITAWGQDDASIFI
jgi:hypothetical protein